MKILIIGGTRFVGRHLVDTALSRGHTLTLFNRGQSNPDLYPQVETIRGDREKDLEKLSGQRWEAVIDTCGYLPRLVNLSAQALDASAFGAPPPAAAETWFSLGPIGTMHFGPWSGRWNAWAGDR